MDLLKTAPALTFERLPKPEPIAMAATLHDADALLAALYDEHAPGIYRFCLGMLRRREDAEDCLQQVWLQLAAHADKLLAADDPRAYLWRSVRNQLASRLRRRALEWLWTPPLEAEVAELAIAADADLASHADLYRALAALSPRLRAVALLVGVDGATLEDAALRLDIPRGTAASRWHAALQKLRLLLKEMP